MPILVVKNESGLSERVEIEQALPAQPIYLKTISWSYDPASLTALAFHLPNAVGGSDKSGYNTAERSSNNNNKRIHTINAKIDFIDNFDANNTAGQGGMISIPVNAMASGHIFCDWEFLPSVNISKLIDLNFFIGQEPLFPKLETGDKMYFQFVFSYGTNERI